MSRSPDLVALLEEIGPPPGGGGGARFSALPIPGMARHRLAKGSNGEPALLLSTRDDGLERSPPAIQLEHLAVQHNVRCRLYTPKGEALEAPFTVIRFTGGDAELKGYFLRVLSPILITLGSFPDRNAIYQAVEALVVLFRAVSQPPRKSVQGLWAELLLIACAANPARLVEAWHATPEDRYDFSEGPDRIEVKSASTRSRRHRYSLSQLRPVEGTQVVVASVLVESAGAGISLAEMIERVRRTLGSTPHLSLTVDRVVSSTLGSNLGRGLEMRFDWELAVETLAFYDARSVPSIPCELPSTVSDVRLVVDMEGLAPLVLSPATHGLFEALLPLRKHG